MRYYTAEYRLKYRSVRSLFNDERTRTLYEIYSDLYQETLFEKTTIENAISEAKKSGLTDQFELENDFIKAQNLLIFYDEMTNKYIGTK